MASNQVDISDEVDFSVFGMELPRLDPYAKFQGLIPMHKMCMGCLLNNGMYIFQPNFQMDLRVAIIRLFIWCTFRVHRWLTLISALARNSIVQAFESSSLLESTEQPFLRILYLTVMWSSAL